MATSFREYASVWCIVVVVEVLSGDPLEPIALAAMELGATSVVQIAAPQLSGMCHPPYPTVPHTLIVTTDA